MAKGGQRIGAGRPKKPLAEKILEGNPGKRNITVLDFGVPLEACELPTPPDYLAEAAKGMGSYPSAAEIFEKVTAWLETTGCLHLIPPEHIAEYSLLKARWLECESKNAQHGLLAKHPTSGQPIASPYMRIGIDYLSAADNAWGRIWTIVTQNSQQDFKSNSPNNDIMERLLGGSRK